jgi:molecular chaperone GrpE
VTKPEFTHDETRQPAAAEADLATPPAADAAEPQAADPDLARLRAELTAAQDRELRCHAELDNYRKRAARELEERLRYANMGLLRDLLPVVDNVDRAIAAAENNADAAALLEGFKMVHKQLGEALARHHCRPIDALFQPFDPHKHHAVMQQPSADHPPHTVLIVTQNGYELHDRVVRPSQVIVSKTE